MNVPWVCKYLLHACTKGEVGCTYRAWTSVVFLLKAGIAKASRSVKTDDFHAFVVYMHI